MSHPIVQRLRDPDPAERRAACRAAVADPAAALLVDALGEVLGDRDRSVARAASDALAALAGRGSGARDALRAALRSDDPRRRFAAAETQARLEPPGLRLLAPAVEALGSPDPDARWSAARLLVDIGRVHGEVLPLVVGLVREARTPAARRMATFALRELAPERPEAARVMLEASRDADPALRRAALSGLAALVEPPPEVHARLIEALAEADDPVARRIATSALGALGRAEVLPAAALSALRELAADDGDADLRLAARRALQHLET